MTPEQRARLVKLMTYLTDQRAWWSDKWLPNNAAQDTRDTIDEGIAALDALLAECAQAKADAVHLLYNTPSAWDEDAKERVRGHARELADRDLQAAHGREKGTRDDT